MLLYGLRFSKEDHVYFIKVSFELFITRDLDTTSTERVGQVGIINHIVKLMAFKILHRYIIFFFLFSDVAFIVEKEVPAEEIGPCPALEASV